MRLLLLLFAIIISSSLYAQKEQPRSYLPNWDSINNARLGTDYVPFNITTLDGKELNNQSTIGKVCFFSFWFEGCHPCLDEFDELNELYSNFKNDTNVVIVAVTFDKQEDITDVLTKYDVWFPVACVSRKDAKQMNYGSGCPNAVLLDKQGKVRRSGFLTITSSNNKNTITVDSATRLINRYR